MKGLYVMLLLAILMLSHAVFNVARPNGKPHGSVSSRTIQRTLSKREKLTTDSNSNSNSNSNERGETKEASEEVKVWLELEGIPPKKVPVKRGNNVILECQAVGSPPPMIHWLKNGKPIEKNLPIESEEYPNRVDTRISGYPIQLQKGHSFAMAKVKSKLPLHCVRPEDEGKYTCIAENGEHEFSANTDVTIIEENEGKGGRKRYECDYEYRGNYYNNHPAKKAKVPAYISAAETLHMEAIGNDIMLPCRATGHPRPYITWIDSDGQTISSSIGKKYQIKSNGDLIIRNLSWSAMGEFSCIVENAYGSDSVSTFVYPLLTDEEDDK